MKNQLLYFCMETEEDSIFTKESILKTNEFIRFLHRHKISSYEIKSFKITFDFNLMLNKYKILILAEIDRNYNKKKYTKVVRKYRKIIFNKNY